MEIVAEVWRAVVGYEGLYEVSSAGRVRSLDRDVVYRNGSRRHLLGQVLKTCIATDGYPVVGPSKSGRQKSLYVHKLVARAFIGERQEGHEVNHIDCNKTNNAIENLEYLTQYENCMHYWNRAAESGGTYGALGTRHGSCKLTEEKVIEIRRLREAGVVLREIAETFHVSQMTISKISRRKTWTHVV